MVHSLIETLSEQILRCLDEILPSIHASACSLAPTLLSQACSSLDRCRVVKAAGAYFLARLAGL